MRHIVRSGRGPTRSSSPRRTAAKRSIPGTARRSDARRVAASSTVVSRVIPAEAGPAAGVADGAGRAGPVAVSLRGVGGAEAARTARSASAIAASTDSGVLNRGGAATAGVDGAWAPRAGGAAVGPGALVGAAVDAGPVDAGPALADAAPPDDVRQLGEHGLDDGRLVELAIRLGAEGQGLGLSLALGQHDAGLGVAFERRLLGGRLGRD